MHVQSVIKQAKNCIHYSIQVFHQGAKLIDLNLSVYNELQSFIMSSTQRRFNISLNFFSNLSTCGYQYTESTRELSKGLGKRTFSALIKTLYQEGIINSHDIIGVEAQGSAGVDSKTWDYDLLPLVLYYQRNFGFECDIDLASVTRLDLDDNDDGVVMTVSVETLLSKFDL